MQTGGGEGVADAAEALGEGHAGGGEGGDEARGVPVVNVDGAGVDEVVVEEVGSRVELEQDHAGLAAGRGLEVVDELEGKDALLGLRAAFDG